MAAPTTEAESVSITRLPSDFEGWQALLDLILRAFAYMDGVIDPPSSARRLTRESLKRKCLGETVFAAFDGASLVGCIFLDDRGDHAYVGKLAVEPSLQGRGIGRRLMEAAEGEARRRGRRFLELQTRVELTANHAAFARLGFRETGRTAHAGYCRPTSLTMRKDLASDARAE
jgi:GNAT superfamily N-acetyltransferase